MKKRFSLPTSLFHVIKVVLLAVCFMSCNQGENSMNSHAVEEVKGKADRTEENFFPITQYLNGEIRNMWESGNRIVLIRNKGKKKEEILQKDDTLSMQTYFQDFLSPTIDSSRLTGKYVLSQFMDETIHAITLSYEHMPPISTYPEWLNWNVYIHPESGLVTKLFLVKQTDSTHQQQLTWRSGKECLIRTFEKDTLGTLHLTEERAYKWN